MKSSGIKTDKLKRYSIKPARTLLKGRATLGKNTAWINLALAVMATTDSDKEDVNHFQDNNAQNKSMGNCGPPLLNITRTSNIYTPIIISGSSIVQKKPKNLLL
jgi:hypothetical protein